MMAASNKDVLFDRSNTQQGLTHDEMWDDSLLIEQYDRSMQKIRHQMEKRVVSQMTESEMSDNLHTSDGNFSLSARAGSNEKSNHTADNGDKKKKKKNKKKKNSWHVGDFCRAKYSEDGELYESTILSINKDQGTCYIRYLGYGNEEEVPFKRVCKSLGENKRASILRSFGDETESGTESEVQSESCQEQMPSLSRTKMPPPPPTREGVFFKPEFVLPIPPTSLPNLPPPPPPILGGLREDSEALNTMLLSWYMTGYHTGFYHGKKEALTPTVINPVYQQDPRSGPFR